MSKKVSSRAARAILAVAVAPMVAKAGTGALYTAGLYDTGTIPGTSVSHVANYNSANNTYTLTNNSVSSGVLNNNAALGSVPLVSSLGAIAGSAYRYTNDTVTSGSVGSNTWYYNPANQQTYVTGLTGAAYTGTTGGQGNYNYYLNDAGDVAGEAGYYNGSSAIGNYSAWIYSAPTVANPSGVTTQIELPSIAAGPGESFQTTFVTNNGGTSTGAGGNFAAESYSPAGMNPSGMVIGTAAIYLTSNGSTMGQAAWVSGTNGAAARIGLTSANYTAVSSPYYPAGYESSSVSFINASGQTAGTSSNYSVNTSSGYTDGFFYNPSTGNSIQIGLSDLANTDPNYSAAYTSSTISAMNAVTVSGTTSTPSFGGTAWSYNIAAGKTTNVTLVGTTPINTVAGAYNGGSTAAYVGSTTTTYPIAGEYQLAQISNAANDINASGEIAGNQRIYIVGGTSTGTSSAGSDSFLYNGTTTQVIGLTDVNHTAASGSTVRTDSVAYISNAGYVSGTATIYNGNPNATANTNQGTDAWVYSPLTTSSTIIGLKSTTAINNAVYVGSVSSSSVSKMNNNGYVVGTTTRYTSSSVSTTNGQDAYFYTPGGGSVQIGLTTVNTPTGPYLSSDGLTESSTVSLLNNNPTDPEAAGTTVKYSGASTNGNDAWLYDSASKTTYGITTLTNPTVQYLSDNGVLVGSYTSGSTTDAYAFSVVNGTPTLVDFGNDASLLAAGGWQQLASDYVADSLGDIVGRGILTGDAGAYNAASNSAVYIVAVPEPASLGLLGVGAIGLLGRRRRSAKN